MKGARRAGMIVGCIRCLGCAGAAFAIMAVGAPAAAAGTPAWQIATTVHYGPAGNASGFSVVIAPAKNDAWVFGGTNPGGTGTPTAQHWNGTAWRPAALPSRLTDFVVAAGASSASNIWAIGDGYALCWDGARWTVAKTWSPSGEATSVAVVSRTDVWVFGASSGTDAGLGTWHYNGREWIRATGIAATIDRASPVSRHDIWAITAGPGGGSVVHYDGHAWQRVTAAAALLAGTQLSDILSVSPHSVWVSGIAPASGMSGHLILAHWDGTGWKRFTAPWDVAQPERFAPDGQGGIWIPAVTSGARPATWILHLSRSGAWTGAPIAPAAGAGVGVGDLALVPGTTTLWGTGGTLTADGGDAAIWEHGRASGHLSARGPARSYRPAWQQTTVAGGGLLRPA